MSEIVPNLDWDSDDTRALREFFKTRTGSKVIGRVSEFMPPLLDGGDVNKTLVRNGEVRGWSDAIRTLVGLSIATPTPDSPVPTNYPSLTDDSAWTDGQKTA
jgi:hypothetical protein